MRNEPLMMNWDECTDSCPLDDFRKEVDRVKKESNLRPCCNPSWIPIGRLSDYLHNGYVILDVVFGDKQEVEHVMVFPKGGRIAHPVTIGMRAHEAIKELYRRHRLI